MNIVEGEAMSIHLNFCFGGADLILVAVGKGRASIQQRILGQDGCPVGAGNRGRPIVGIVTQFFGLVADIVVVVERNAR